MLRGLAGGLVMLGLVGGADANDQASARSSESEAKGGGLDGRSSGSSEIRSRAGRLIVENSTLVKDGMDLQRDSQGLLRRVEIRAAGAAAAAGTTVVGRSEGD
jgi:hypothetical protein